MILVKHGICNVLDLLLMWTEAIAMFLGRSRRK